MIPINADCRSKVALSVSLYTLPCFFPPISFLLYVSLYCPCPFVPSPIFSIPLKPLPETQVNYLKGAFLAVHRSKTFVCFNWAFGEGGGRPPRQSFAGYHHGKVIMAYFSFTRNFTERASHCTARMRLLLNDLVRKSAVWKLLRGGLSFTISQRQTPPHPFSWRRACLL